MWFAIYGLSWYVATRDFLGGLSYRTFLECCHLGLSEARLALCRWCEMRCLNERMRVRRQEERHDPSSGWTATDSAPTTVWLRVSVPRTSRDGKHPVSYPREWCIFIGWHTNDNAEGCSIDTIARQSTDISPGTNLQKRDRNRTPITTGNA
jgi:hypothetical protein